MASLKEVKQRIASVQNTRKITSAMKMVASAKLHKAGAAIAGMRPYERKLEAITGNLVASLQGEFATPYAAIKEIKRVVLVVYASNASLCGGYNSNVIKKMKQQVAFYQQQGAEVEIVPIGRKVNEAVGKLQGVFVFGNHYDYLVDHPLYQAVRTIAQTLMRRFVSGEIDKVELIYHQFKSTATQVLTVDALLPFAQQSQGDVSSREATNYLIEPSSQEALADLIPKTLSLKLYAALLDSIASEHAARVVAMQVATDNADDLLQQLTLTYNKTRQQAITAELLDIIGGSIR